MRYANCGFPSLREGTAMNIVGAAQRVIHAKRDRRADRDEAEDRRTDEFLTALGVLRAKGERSAEEDAS
jgi:regulator of protease activity HflC (stomatin/prohibitin superfamily)